MWFLPDETFGVQARSSKYCLIRQINLFPLALKSLFTKVPDDLSDHDLSCQFLSLAEWPALERDL